MKIHNNNPVIIHTMRINQLSKQGIKIIVEILNNSSNLRRFNQYEEQCKVPLNSSCMLIDIFNYLKNKLRST